MDKIRVAVIGAGNMGFHHVRNYYFQSDVELVGIVDKSESRLQQVAEKFPINIFSDYHEIIDRVDAVSIATPTSTHYEVAMEFLKNKKHVLIEKPITNNLEEAQDLIELADKNKVVLAVGHIERFNPVMNELENILKNEIPLYIDIHRESPYDARIFDADVVADLMIHDLDLLFYVLKQNVGIKSAYGIKVYSSMNDLVNAQMISENGTLINMTASRVTEQKIRQWRVVLPQVLIEVDLMERKIFITRRTSVSMETQKFGLDIKYRQEQLMEKVLVPNYEPLQMEIQDFLFTIRQGGKPKVGGFEGYKALELSREIQQILTKKHVVSHAV